MSFLDIIEQNASPIVVILTVSSAGGSRKEAVTENIYTRVARKRENTFQRIEPPASALNCHNRIIAVS